MGHSAKLLNYAHLNIFYLRVSSRNKPNQSKRQSQLREAREAKRAKLSSDDTFPDSQQGKYHRAGVL